MSESAKRIGLVGALLAASLFPALPAFAERGAAHPAERALADDVMVRVLAPGVWLHRTSDTRDGTPVVANGLLVATKRFALLIDTGWNAEQTARLLEWAEGLARRPVEHVVVTHAHDDRAGGLAAVPADSVIVQGHSQTRARLPAAGRSIDWEFEFQETVDVDGERIVLFYPGHGHAPDNIVVWMPDRALLFGGCLIRPLEADGLGFTGDADLDSWSTAVDRVIRLFREARIVVPGHGAPGGVELLSHTMELLEAAGAAPPGGRGIRTRTRR